MGGGIISARLAEDEDEGEKASKLVAAEDARLLPFEIGGAVVDYIGEGVGRLDLPRIWRSSRSSLW